MLDAAKTNRALQLLQSEPSSNDFIALATGCIFGETNVISPKNNAIIGALCESYKQCSRFTTTLSKKKNDEESSRSMFHLRDFVYFLRYIRKHSRIGGSANFELTPQVLLRGLQRNFNGIMKEEFQSLVFLFFKNINNALDRLGLTDWEIPNSLYTTTSIDLLKESLSDNLGKYFT